MSTPSQQQQIITGLIKKWEKVLGGVDQTLQPVAAALLENQARVLGSSITGPPLSPRMLTRLLSAIVGSFVDSVLWRICSVQPMLQPVGIVFHYEADHDQAAGHSGMPTITMRIVSKEIVARSRQTRTLFADPDLLTEMATAADRQPISTLGSSFDQIWGEIAREILNNIRTICETEREWLPGNTKNQFMATAHTVHRSSMRAPANWLLCSVDNFAKYVDGDDFKPAKGLLDQIADAADGSEEFPDRPIHAGTYAGRLHVIVDPAAPNDEIIFGYTGQARSN